MNSPSPLVGNLKNMPPHICQDLPYIPPLGIMQTHSIGQLRDFLSNERSIGDPACSPERQEQERYTGTGWNNGVNVTQPLWSLGMVAAGFRSGMSIKPDSVRSGVESHQQSTRTISSLALPIPTPTHQSSDTIVRNDCPAFLCATGFGFDFGFGHSETTEWWSS
jgi:hypothetical protein